MEEQINQNMKRSKIVFRLLYSYVVLFLLVSCLLGTFSWYGQYGKTHRIMSYMYSEANYGYFSQYQRELDDYFDIPDWVYSKMMFIKNDTKFTRYASPKNSIIYGSEIPRLIFEARVGKCEEFSIVAASIAIAKGYDVRIVATMPPGDHTWIEVEVNGTWIHVDPSERLINDPLFYQRRNRTMGVVYAFTIDFREDVSWKYNPD